MSAAESDDRLQPVEAEQAIDARDERKSRLAALFADPLWTLLFLGVVTIAGGMLGVFLSLTRVRPEVVVLRQIPYVVSAIAFGTLAQLGAFACLGFFAWRAFGHMRRLTSELEEAAAALMWERVATSEADRLGSNAAPPPSRTTPQPVLGSAG